MALIIGDSFARCFVQFITNSSYVTSTQHNKVTVGLCIGGLQINQLRWHVTNSKIVHINTPTEMDMKNCEQVCPTMQIIPVHNFTNIQNLLLEPYC